MPPSSNHNIIKYAPGWKRLIAYIIDAILIQVTISVSWFIVLEAPIPVSLIFGIFLFYNVVMDYAFQGTLGKMILRIKVIKVNGEKPDLLTSIVRNVGKIVSWLPLGWGFIRLLSPAYPQGCLGRASRLLMPHPTQD